MSPRLTIGMATFNDFDGVYFSIQALRLYHSHYQKEIEIVVVDQSNNPAHKTMAEHLCSLAGANYLYFPQPTGTSPSRNKVFETATGEFVLCIDSHVLIAPGAIDRLIGEISKEVITDNLYQGPMLQDDLRNFTTHFNHQWRAEMYGTWGRAWQCTCKKFNFSCRQVREEELEYVVLYHRTANTGIRACPNCGQKFPELRWSGHEDALIQRAYYPLGISVNDDPFEIPGQGLGLFGCRKSAWLGFNEHARGFGAEELNIHELYLQKGRKTICLPYLQWSHRFGRVSGIPYPLDRYDKVRNYVLWHQQLNKPLDDIEQHFVESRLMPQAQWDFLLKDPIANVKPDASCNTCGGIQPTANIRSIDEAYIRVKSTPRDVEQHLDKLRELADGCETVTELSIRKEPTIAFLNSKCAKVISYNAEMLDPLLTAIKPFRGTSYVQAGNNPLTPQDIEETDLLFLNDRHTGDRVAWELQTFAPKVKHYIVLHNTQIFMEAGEDGQPPGLMTACRRFMRQNPEWSLIYHSPEQYGLTVLSRKPEDKKRLPGLAKQAVNFAKALAEHVADGGQKVELPIMEERLNICAGCEQRVDGRCGACGCDLEAKASWRSADCPLGLWPAIEESKP